MRSSERDKGMVTAELAACLPVLVLVLAAALAAVSVSGARVRVQDAAREAARAVARGDDAAARDLVRRYAPGASLRLSGEGAQVDAVVTLEEHLLLPFLPSVTLTGRAVAALEPSTARGVPP